MNELRQMKEHTGAWIVHHGRKLAFVTSGSAEFPVLDEAAKASELLARLGQATQTTLSMDQVRAVAVSAGLNPRHELNGLLQVLEEKRLVDRTENEISLIGVTVRGALIHAADLFEDSEPSVYERASIDMSEIVSQNPSRRSELEEQIGDTYSIASKDLAEFFDRAEQIGFVDVEGQGTDKLLFNGNLFRRDCVLKTSRVLESLSSNDQIRVREVADLLNSKGCLEFEEVEKLLSSDLFEKLRAAGLYDLNIVVNDKGEYVYITAPNAFHKFVDPMVDDCFDMAKALVAALTYGMTKRSSGSGRIQALDVLLGKLVAGREVGPATAIGQDYRVLEMKCVIQLRSDDRHPSRYYMRLLKREIGQLALQVLTTGDANPESVHTFLTAPMSGYVGPEESRVRTRKLQTSQSRRQTRDVLEALRGGRSIR